MADQREPTTHDLKTWRQYFEAVWDGRKRFEVRKNDRDFRVGDTLRLREYDEKNFTCTGRVIYADVSYMTTERMFGIDANYCVMSLDRVVLVNNRSRSGC